jgi:hypothetical protein
MQQPSSHRIAKICQDLPRFAKICQDLPRCAKICQDLLKNVEKSGACRGACCRDVVIVCIAAYEKQ